MGTLHLKRKNCLKKLENCSLVADTLFTEIVNTKKYAFLFFKKLLKSFKNNIRNLKI